MFRRNKPDSKSKLEHKLYIARETPEPVFDLSECDLVKVPQGIYSLCRVFLKEVLRLEHNSLSSLSGGGQLKDLHLLKVLDLHDNAFMHLPDDIQFLTNLRELYLNDNQLKKLPDTISSLKNLVILNVANNSLKYLPVNIGNLSRVKFLSVVGNKNLRNLPKSLCKAQNIIALELDASNFMYPPKSVAEEGTESVLKYICNDVGVPYVGPSDDPDDAQIPEKSDQVDALEAKIWTLENIKKQKLQDFLEIEKANEMLQKQEFEVATSQKLNREKLLADITEQQSRLDAELFKIQQEKETERFRLIEQIQEAEENADKAIQHLLEMNREPLAQLLEQERQEEERLINAANKYNETLRKDDILKNMEDILHQESRKFQQFHEDRLEASRSILEQEMESDQHLAELLQNQDFYKAELISKLQKDFDLQKAAVGTLLERGDARSWGLIQEVRLVESQLAALTLIEMDKKKLQIDHHLNDLAEKRINLSILLMDLMQQQNERRQQLLSTLETLEQYCDTPEDFWLRQYQRLLDRLPEGLSEAQKNMDPLLTQALLINGVIHCLPFLAMLAQSECELDKVTEDDLTAAGITNRLDRQQIMNAFQMYVKEKAVNSPYKVKASAPPLLEEASAPPPEHAKICSECVVCFDCECQIIFVPCGHYCCCSICSTPLVDCPMCRATIERKIRVVSP